MAQEFGQFHLIGADALDDLSVESEEGGEDATLAFLRVVRGAGGGPVEAIRVGRWARSLGLVPWRGVGAMQARAIGPVRAIFRGVRSSVMLTFLAE